MICALRRLKGRKAQPSAAIYDGLTLQSSPERAGYDGAKRRRRTWRHLLAPLVTPAVTELSKAVQEVTGKQVEVAFVDQGYSGPQAEQGRHRAVRGQA
jgi:hypothetical protein